MLDLEKINLASKRFPKPVHFKPSYGTAGFRSDASVLASTVFRCGLLTAARSIILGQHCGLMITASHNPEQDNGVKIVEPSGEMLPQSWEPLATELANCSDDEVGKLLQRVLDQAETKADPEAAKNLSVVVGCDTRPSAEELVQAAESGIEALELTVRDLGKVTTPQLHFQVHALNAGLASPDLSLDLYFDTLLGAFEELVKGTKPLPGPLYVDCANGVGAIHLQRVAGRLQAAGLKLQLINVGDGKLNYKCGADFVQKDKVPPSGFQQLEEPCRSVFTACKIKLA